MWRSGVPILTKLPKLLDQEVLNERNDALGCFYGWQVKKTKKKLDTSRLCVSSLRRGHANLLCIVPILTDGYKVTEKWGCLGVIDGDFENRKIWLWDLHDFSVSLFFGEIGAAPPPIPSELGS